MPSDRPQTQMRLTEDGRRLLEKIATYHGLTLRGAAEIAIREYARQLGLLKAPTRK